MNFEARTEADARLLTSLVHDFWFLKDAIEWDPDREEVAIPIGRGQIRRGRWSETDTPPSKFPDRLIFVGVKRYVIEDEADIDLYDINSISFKDTSHLILEANIPLTIHFRGDNLAVVLVHRENDRGPNGH